MPESVVIGETSSTTREPEEDYNKLGVNALLERFSGYVRAVNLSDDAWELGSAFLILMY